VTALRVALVSPRYAPAIGGVERVAEMQARELARRGAHVEVITTDPTASLAAVEERNGVLVRRFRTLANDGVFFLTPRLGAWLNTHAHEFDVVHAHSYHTPLALQAAVATRAARVSLVLTPHYHGTGHSPLRRLLHRPYRPLGGWALRRARRVLCVSAVEEALLRQHFGRSLRTAVVPNGVDADELSGARLARSRRGPADGLNVLFVGRLDRYKRVDRLIRALPHLPSSSRLTIIGDGSQGPYLASVASALQVNGQVTLAGHVSRSNLLAHYASADVFVSLSEHESFGLAVVEAAVAGLPVVASDIPAHREVAAYLGDRRVRFIASNERSASIADTIRMAAASGRATDLTDWRLPTWAQNVDATLDAYGANLATRSAA
jgi:1,2-diacylglycerol 3-alpha-glucosyltransferase